MAMEAFVQISVMTTKVYGFKILMKILWEALEMTNYVILIYRRAHHVVCFWLLQHA